MPPSTHPLPLVELTEPRPRRDALAADVHRGLTGPRKSLPPIYLYDTRGSELIERITQLEEYYPTRAERGILERDADSGWSRLRFGSLEPLDPREPVQHVTYFEAEAFARWAGGRLPTETEWEKAASWDPATPTKRRYPWGDIPPTTRRVNLVGRRFGPAPVGSYPAGASALGVEQFAGDAYEWTSSPFDPYPGFTAFPYNEVFFGGDYRALRGSSWAIEPMMARTTYRNWDHPYRRQIFARLRVRLRPARLTVGGRMCRMAGYVGVPRARDALLYVSPRSLTEQAFAPREQLHGTVNVDGTGVAWRPDHAPGPLRYATCSPPWADENLTELAPALHARAMIAAVRGATSGVAGGRGAVAPFTVADLAIAHNGWLGGFREHVAPRLVGDRPAAQLGDLDVLTDSLLVSDGRRLVGARASIGGPCNSLYVLANGEPPGPTGHSSPPNRWTIGRGSRFHPTTSSR